MMSPTCYGEEESAPLMPVRRLHNYVYCPRLFYLQWVEGVFVPNEDTVIGSALHHRVDSPDKLKEEALTSEGGSLRSISISSERLGLTGVIDLLENKEEGRRRLVDYKKGSPRKGEEGEWVVKNNDAIQIAAYALLLEESGVSVDSASIYYAQIKRHVDVPLNEELFASCLKYLDEAKAVAEKGICPPPLCSSSRCFYCSAYPICLPYETRYWVEHEDVQEEIKKRPPTPDFDPGEIIVVQNNQAYVGLKGGEIYIRVNEEVVSRHPIHQISSLSLYGAIPMSTQALSILMENGIPVSYFSPAGRFLGVAHGLPSSGVDARIGQCHIWGCPEKRLAIAKEVIRSKIHNQRVILMRNGGASETVLKEMARLRDSCNSQPSLGELRGVEGAAALLYFSNFATMLKNEAHFDFNGRNRRPPKDETNSLLSLAYSMLSKELTGVAYSVGLDPYLGFFHSPRYGRPALALDMMEEFRPLIADSVVLTMINRGEVSKEDFAFTTKGVILRDSGRRQFWRAWARRMDTEITHPTFGYKMSYRRMLHVQMRQFWRFCRGDIFSYNGFTTR